MGPIKVHLLCINIFFIPITLLSDQIQACTTPKGNEVGADERLFLTPLIESGNIEEARNKASVQHKDMFNIKSYSGYLTVNKQYNSNTFFWFFPAEKNPANAPVLLWLQGGPGATSLSGLFNENGPFIVTQNITIKLRDYPWSFGHNVIYMDNPIGTGFSFTDHVQGYATSSEQIGLDLHVALTQFFLLFPELQNNDFYVTGESMAGKYVPALSYVIHEKNPTAAIKINLKGLAIGNGITDPINQFAYGDYLYQIGLIDSNGRDQYHAYETVYTSLIRQKDYFQALKIFDRMLLGVISPEPTLFFNLTGFNYFYNYHHAKKPVEATWMDIYMEKVDVKHAIHVGNSHFQHQSKQVPKYLSHDVTRSEADKVALLLEYYRVLIYNGQLDIVVAYPLTVNYLKNLGWSGADAYATAERKIWTVDDEVAGYTKTADNLTEVLVRNAGHMAPMDQCKWMFELITRFTGGDRFN